MKRVEAARRLYSAGRPAEALMRLDEMTLREFLPTAQVLRALISHRLGRPALAARQLREVIDRPESSAAERLFAREVLERLGLPRQRPPSGRSPKTQAQRWPAPLRSDTSAYRWRYFVGGGGQYEVVAPLAAPSSRIPPAAWKPTPPKASSRRSLPLWTDPLGAMPKAWGPSSQVRLEQRARAQQRKMARAALRARRYAEARQLLLGLASGASAELSDLVLLGKAQAGAGDLSGALRTIHRLDKGGADQAAETLRRLIESADAER